MLEGRCVHDGARRPHRPLRYGAADRFAAAAGCEAVTESKHLQIKIYDADGTLASVQNLHDVVVTAGAAPVMLDRVDSGRTIDVQAQVRTGSASRTLASGHGCGDAAARSLVSSVQAPLQTLPTRAVDVVAEIAEVKGDTSATAHVT